MNTTAINQEVYDELVEKAKETKNVAIFIDFDNIYYSMKSYAIDITNPEYNICKLLNEVYGMKKIRTFRAYADFDQVGVKMKELQEQRVQIRNVYGNGKEEKYRKNASDIELSIDVLESYYRDKDIDTYVIVTADSDMIPIMSRMMYKGKDVHLFYTKENVSQVQHIETYCDYACDVLELYNVDKSKSDPKYWIEDIKNMMIEWYANPLNKGKIYGFKWLASDASKKFNLSVQLISDVINEMTNIGIIKSGKIGDSNGYVIVEETTQTADKEDVENKEVCDDVNQKNVDTEVEE